MTALTHGLFEPHLAASAFPVEAIDVGSGAGDYVTMWDVATSPPSATHAASETPRFAADFDAFVL